MVALINASVVHMDPSLIIVMDSVANAFAKLELQDVVVINVPIISLDFLLMDVNVSQVNFIVLQKWQAIG